MELAALPDDGRYQVGVDRFRELLGIARAKNLKPPPKLTLSEWAAEHAYLSPETSAETGRFRAFPYQVGMMDAVTDPSVWMITVKKSARVGYTKILDHIVAYYIAQDPSPILVVQPTKGDAEDYSATEIEPMLRDTPVLAEIVGGDLKAKSSKQKLTRRLFRNGASIRFIGAESPNGFRRITCRLVLFDEVNGYPALGAGKEGDQLKLGIKRTESFWNRKVVIGSTPTEEGASRIDKSWLLSDQRRYFVPCPHCAEMQVLEWGGKDVPYGMKWDHDDAGDALAETAHYLCVNGCIIEEVDKPEMVAAGEWRATAPFNGHAGFHIWAAYSLFPNAAWSALVQEWLDTAGDPLQRQTFHNLVLGEDYADRGLNALDERRLLGRCETYPSELPDGVAIVTCGVDVQGDRLELEVVGWGRNEESWSLAYEVLDGDPGEPEVWAELDAFLKDRRWIRADGRPFAIEAACIDTGGSHTEDAYRFCRDRLGRNVWGIKGESAQGGRRNPVWPTKVPTRRTRKTYRPVILGVNAAKDVVRQSLKIERPGPRYMHFPDDRDLNYFSALISERAVLRETNGHKYWIWDLPPGRVNEPLDCRVYAYGALCGRIRKGLKLNRRADDVRAAITVVEDDAVGPEVGEETPAPAPRAAPIPRPTAARASSPPAAAPPDPPAAPPQATVKPPPPGGPSRAKSAAERLAARLSRMR